MADPPPFTLASVLGDASLQFSRYSSAVQNNAGNNEYNYYMSINSVMDNLVNTVPLISQRQFTDSAEQSMDNLSVIITQYLALAQAKSAYMDRGFLPGGPVTNLVQELFDEYYSRISLSCDFLPAFSSDVSAVSNAFGLYASKFSSDSVQFVQVATCTPTSLTASSAVSTSSPADTCAATLSSVVLDGTVHACRVVPSCSPVIISTEAQSISVSPSSTAKPTSPSITIVTTTETP